MTDTFVPATATGSITVCKVVVDKNGQVMAAGSMPSGDDFFVPGFISSSSSTASSSAGLLPSTSFATPLNFNTELFGASAENAQCTTYGGLAIGHWYYGQESIVTTTDKWATPKYNDQLSVPASSTSDFFLYSPELYDGNPANDGQRNLNSDGDIELTAARPSREVIVLNQFLGGVATTSSTLIVVTDVTNSGIGVKTASDFTDTVTGTDVMPTSTLIGSASGTSVTVASGTFSIVQDPTSGYTVSYSANCSGTIAAGATKTCVISDTDKPLPPKVCSVDGLYGMYNNLLTTTEGMDGPITGVTTGTTPFQYDWYDPIFYSFASNTPITAFDQPQNFFPVNDNLPGDPFYTAIHWSGSVNFPASGTYPINLGSDDDSWLYINGHLVDAVPGIHPIAYATSTYTVQGAATATIDLYFAERHPVQSGIVFQMPGVTFSPCATGTSTLTADVAIAKSVSNPAPHAGDTVNYTVAVSNGGPATAIGVVASDTLPGGMTFVSASVSTGTYATSTGIWTVGNLPANATATLTIAATVYAGDAAGQVITNTATVSESSTVYDPNWGTTLRALRSRSPRMAAVAVRRLILPS